MYDQMIDRSIIYVMMSQGLISQRSPTIPRLVKALPIIMGQGKLIYWNLRLQQLNRIFERLRSESVSQLKLEDKMKYMELKL